MSSFKAFPSGILLGFGLAYFLDPLRGRKRRARVGEMFTHARKVERNLVGKAARDAEHRVHGLAERVRHAPSPDVPDEVIEARVKSVLGRCVTHPRALEVTARNGTVSLRGQIPENEIEPALRAIGRVSGVREIETQLERLPPISERERRLARRAGVVWPPSIQVGAAAAGLGLTAWGLLLRRGLVGLLAAGGGAALVARSLFDRPIVGPDAEVELEKTIHVHAPVDRVFKLWSNLENLPRFLQHVRSVDVRDKRSSWRVDGPAGTVLQFEAECTQFEPNRLIAWSTLPNQPIHHEGVVRFDSEDDGTRVHIRMKYAPPAGVVGHALAHVLGWDPKSRMDRDLVRMKALLEQGKTRAHGHRVSIDDLDLH